MNSPDIFLKLTKQDGKTIIIPQSSINSIEETDKCVVVTYTCNRDVFTIKCNDSIKDIEEHIVIPTIIKDPFNPVDMYEDDDEECPYPPNIYDDNEPDKPFAPPF